MSVKGVLGVCIITLCALCCVIKVDFGGGGRVRTRNTLHIVVARKSSICYNAVERRKDDKRKRENKMRNKKYDKI